MQTDCRKPLVLLTSWSLLGVWLFFGTLALAEQMNLVMMNTTHEEYALSQLASGLKRDVSHVEDRLGSSVTAAASAPPSLVCTAALDQVPRTTVRDLPAVRLHQRVSVYRI